MSAAQDPRVDLALKAVVALFLALCAWTFRDLATEVRTMGRDLNGISQRVAVVEAKIAARMP